MATRGISIRCVGVLLAGGILWLGVHPSWAAETPTATKSVPSTAAGRSATADSVANDGPEPIPAPSPTVVPFNKDDNFQLVHQATPEAECDDSADCCGLPICSPPGRIWLRADYLAWWTNGTNLPPLVTTSPQGTSVAQAGVLPNATILYGNQTIGNDGRAGVRTTMGMWLDNCHDWDVEFDYFMLGQRSFNYDSGFSTGDPILARPLFNIQTGSEGRELVAYPGQVEGSVAVGSTYNFYSAGALLSYHLCSCNSCCGGCNSCGSCNSCASCDSCNGSCDEACCPPLLCCCRTDLLVGFRFYRLDDDLGITENLQSTADDPTNGTKFNILDSFNAKNEFYGAELGLRTQIYRGRWSLDILTKLAMGNTHQTVTIAGQTVITPPTGTAVTYNSGVLASSTNSGTFQNDAFTIIPQLGLELGYQINCHWRAYVGYDVLYWGSVVKAADQVDLNVDPRNIPPQQAGGLPFPAYPGRISSFWAQGVNVGGEYRF
jgi:hypothetical protein